MLKSGTLLLMPGQIRRAKKFSSFLSPFLHLVAVKKDSKNGAARKVFGPSYFDPALVGKCQILAF